VFKKKPKDNLDAAKAKAKAEEEQQTLLKNFGVMFLCSIAGYGLAQYQNNKRQQEQICYTRVTSTKSLPDYLADKAEEVIKAGGQAGIRRVGALLELVVQNATGDTQIFREAYDKVKDVGEGFEKDKAAPTGTAGTRGSRRDAEYATNVEFYDEDTDTWRAV
jgi:hypothetical protein